MEENVAASDTLTEEEEREQEEEIYTRGRSRSRSMHANDEDAKNIAPCADSSNGKSDPPKQEKPAIVERTGPLQQKEISALKKVITFLMNCE